MSEGIPKFWITAIAKSLSGDQPCLLSTWIHGHLPDREKRPSGDPASLATWKVNHTAQLQALVEKLKGDGWKCSVERFFRVEGHTSIISGKADCIAQQADKRPVIWDAKSGTPRESDIVQVALEMILVPMSWNAPTMIFDGHVAYKDHDVVITPKQAEQIRPKAFALLKHLGMVRRPDASPSLGSCRFCDVSAADCPDRVEQGSEIIAEVTGLF